MQSTHKCHIICTTILWLFCLCRVRCACNSVQAAGKHYLIGEKLAKMKPLLLDLPATVLFCKCAFRLHLFSFRLDIKEMFHWASERISRVRRMKNSLKLPNSLFFIFFELINDDDDTDDIKVKLPKKHCSTFHQTHVCIGNGISSATFDKTT